MPVTRRSTGGARARSGPGKGQSTISFASKVTKPVPKDVGGKKAAAIVSEATAAATPHEKKPTSVEPESPAAAEDVSSPYAESPEREVEEEEEEKKSDFVEKTEAELRAEGVTDAQVRRYWRSIEQMRRTKTVHQDDLSVGEKVLTYFDMSSEYGPCIGMPRMKRWQRAERLGLNPPIEVLAILLKEENEGNVGIEQASMDVIMNSIAVGSH